MPNVAITARDADVIKTYVRLRARRGHRRAHGGRCGSDPELKAIDASHLFAAHTTWIGFRRGTLLRKYMYDFAQLLAPHLERRLIESGASRRLRRGRCSRCSADVDLPQR